VLNCKSVRRELLEVRTRPRAGRVLHLVSVSVDYKQHEICFWPAFSYAPKCQSISLTKHLLYLLSCSLLSPVPFFVFKVQILGVHPSVLFNSCSRFIQSQILQSLTKNIRTLSVSIISNTYHMKIEPFQDSSTIDRILQMLMFICINIWSNCINFNPDQI
jgi:hypothetical protein